jgi:hypothetical protein
MANNSSKDEEVDDETARLLKQIVDHFDDEDRAVRDRQIRTWRRLKLLWKIFRMSITSEVGMIGVSPKLSAQEKIRSGFYDKPVNVYRAYLNPLLLFQVITVPLLFAILTMPITHLTSQLLRQVIR